MKQWQAVKWWRPNFKDSIRSSTQDCRISKNLCLVRLRIIQELHLLLTNVWPYRIWDQCLMRQIKLSLDQHHLQRQAKGAIQIWESFWTRLNRVSHRRDKTPVCQEEGLLSLVNPQLTGQIPNNQQLTYQWITTWSSYKKGLRGSKIKSIQTTWITIAVLWARDKDYQKTNLRLQLLHLKRKTKRTFKSA